MAQPDFLRTKNLNQLDEKEWESLCDHCGICCLHKVMDVETNEIYTTRVICEFYDLESRKCSVYNNRSCVNADCTKITPDNIAELSWLPYSCAYRCVYEQRPLPRTHPLISGETPRPGNNTLEQIFGCDIVVYDESMDITDYIVSCQSS